jgi:transposase-like protein
MNNKPPELVPNSPEWCAFHGVRPLPHCPRCGTTPPEIVAGANGPECADCGSQSMDLFLWPTLEQP